MPKPPKLGKVRKDGQPVLGMKFEKSRDKLLKFTSSRNNPAMKESLINQVKLHEGVGAAKELRTEINSTYDQEVRRKVGGMHMKGVDARAGRGSGNRGYVMTDKERAEWEANRTFEWCPDCDERCYIYTIIHGSNGHNVSRCSRCGTDCIKLNQEELYRKQEEGNGRENT